MNYSETAKEIIKNVGSSNNVESLTHCVTRLRFKLMDIDLVNRDRLEKIDGVLSVQYSNGEFQVIIGNEVGKVYDAILDQGLIDKSENKSQNTSATKQENKNFKYYFDLVLEVITACFTPIIPVIAGSGMIKVLNAILISLGVLTTQSQTYILLNALGDAVYYYLPIFVALTAAKRLKADTFTSMAVAACMLYPKLTAIASQGSGQFSFIGIPMKLVDYSSQALPIVLVVILVKYVDKFSDKITPSIVKTFLRPMITILVSAPIALLVLSPITNGLGFVFTGFVNLMNSWGWIAVGINAALFPILVLTGTHNALIPLMVQMFATQGFDPVLVPSGLAANLAESASAAAVAVKTKSKVFRSTATGAALSALFGITEPALYGVNLRLRRPFVSMLIGSFLGGSVAGLLHLTAYAFVAPSIISLPIYIGKRSSLLTAILTAIAGFIMTFIVTWIIGFKDIDNEQKSSKEEKESNKDVEGEKFQLSMQSPAHGEIHPLEQLNDGVFSKKLMGEGFYVTPEDGKILSPVDGKVTSVFPTKHAIGITTKDGAQVLVHMGIDTVRLEGHGFKNLVKEGEQVNREQHISDMDLDLVKENGYRTDVVVVITNTKNYKKINKKTKKGVVDFEIIK